ncbi:hypothetical protein [Lacunimicrobium album]
MSNSLPPRPKRTSSSSKPRRAEARDVKSSGSNTKKTRKKKSSTPAWLPFAIGGGVLAVVIVGVVIMSGPGMKPLAGVATSALGLGDSHRSIMADELNFQLDMIDRMDQIIANNEPDKVGSIFAESLEKGEEFVLRFYRQGPITKEEIEQLKVSLDFDVKIADIKTRMAANGKKVMEMLASSNPAKAPELMRTTQIVMSRLGEVTQLRSAAIKEIPAATDEGQKLYAAYLKDVRQLASELAQALISKNYQSAYSVAQKLDKRFLTFKRETLDAKAKNASLMSNCREFEKLHNEYLSFFAFQGGTVDNSVKQKPEMQMIVDDLKANVRRLELPQITTNQFRPDIAERQKLFPDQSYAISNANQPTYSSSMTDQLDTTMLRFLQNHGENKVIRIDFVNWIDKASILPFAEKVTVPGQKQGILMPKEKVIIGMYATSASLEEVLSKVTIPYATTVEGRKIIVDVSKPK